MFFEDFLEVADTHTNVCANSYDTAQIYGFKKNAFLPLFNSLIAQGFRQV